VDEHGKYAGRGRIVELTGESKYVGEWLGGKKHGFGRLVFKDGSYYEGGFSDGLYHGNGTLFLTDTSRYVGQFAANLKNGVGKETWKNGDMYSGSYSENQRHGKGKMWISGLGTYKGEW
jgi:hypothetical protein